MKRYRITLGDQSFDVHVIDDPRQEEVRVEVDGEMFTVGVETVRDTVRDVDAAPAAQAPTGPGQRPRAQPVPSSTAEVTAPLPGVVKSIAVRTGQRVAAGDTLLTIEAMKMDNVIRAPRGGAIEVIHVAEGSRVAHGDPLLAFKDNAQP